MQHFRHGRSIIFAYAGVALPALIALFLYPSLIRNLGVERFGALSLVLSIAIFFSSFDFGVGLAVTRYVARLNSRTTLKASVRRLVRHAIVLQICIGTLIAFVLLCFQKVWGFLGSTSSPKLLGEFDLAILWLAASIPLALISGVIRCALEGVGRYGLANALRAPASIGVFAAPIACSFVTDRIDLMILAMLLARAVTTLIFLLFLGNLPKDQNPPPPNFKDFFRHGRLLLMYGGWVMMGTAAGGLIIFGILDRFFIARVSDISFVIQYSVPSDIIIRGLLIPSAISSVIVTILAGTVASSPQMVPKVHRGAMKLTAGQAGPIAVLLVVHAEKLLALLTGQKVAMASVWILKGMATGYFIQCLAHIPYCGLHAAGKPSAAGFRHLVQLPFYAAGSFLLLLSGHIQWLGWMWCLWALIDLLMLFTLLRWLAPEQRAFEALTNPRVLIWFVALGFTILLSELHETHAIMIIISLLASAIFAWNVVRMAGSRTIWE